MGHSECFFPKVIEFRTYTNERVKLSLHCVIFLGPQIENGEITYGCLLGCCAMKTEAASTSVTSVNLYQTIWRKNRKDSSYILAAVRT
jgi:hypothetical protein